MNYLWWYVPGITAPMLIGLMAGIHVLLAHYAVGGGLFLGLESVWARKTQNQEYLEYLRKHTRFFVLATVILGSITGMGIWWATSTASPLSGEILNRTFLFAWAGEWLFFLVEISAAFCFLFLWDRLSPRNHGLVGSLYAFTAWGSLVLITGITSFMLDPGKWPTLTEAGMKGNAFWSAFFNPQFLPQLTARTGLALLIAAASLLFHSSICGKSDSFKQLVVKRMIPYFSGGLALTFLGFVWIRLAFSPAAKLALARSAPLSGISVCAMLAFIFLAGLFLLIVFRPHRHSPTVGVLFLLLAFFLLSAGEFIQETVRKPFALAGCVYGNQIHVSQIETLRKEGLLESGPWTKAWVSEKWPHLLDPATGKLDLNRVKDEERAEVGEVIFMHHCNACHAKDGFCGMANLAVSSRPEGLKEFLKNLNSMNFSMPPWCGTDKEAELLAVYLESIAKKYPFLEKEKRWKSVEDSAKGERISETASSSSDSSGKAASGEPLPSVSQPAASRPAASRPVPSSVPHSSGKVESGKAPESESELNSINPQDANAKGVPHVSH